MSEFVYLFRGGEAAGSPEQTQRRNQKWIAWMKELGGKGVIKDPGRPLARSGKLVKGTQEVVSDGPYAEANGLVGGYMLVEAMDLTHAVELSSGCPIFETGGFVEVRPIMKI